jgi:predicted metal-dependent hydrolase
VLKLRKRRFYKSIRDGFKIQRLNEIKEISANLEIYNHENLSELVNLCVEKIGRILKLKPNKIIFRKMKVRWGSCHPEKGIIIFNKFLKYLPKELIGYIVLHEMCHLIVRNHKKEFWLLVKKLDPNFKEKEKLLAGYRVRLNLV